MELGLQVFYFSCISFFSWFQLLFPGLTSMFVVWSCSRFWAGENAQQVLDANQATVPSFNPATGGNTLRHRKYQEFGCNPPS
jgi:hypothetical protein